MPKPPYDDWDDITPKSGLSTPYDDWEDVEPEPLDTSFGSGYGLPSLQDVYSTALKMPSRLISSGVGALDILQSPWRSMNPSIPAVSSYLRDNLGYDPEGWEQEISEKEDSPELIAAQQEHAKAKGIGGTASSYWRNPGLALLEAESSAPEMLVGGAAGRALKYARPALSAAASGALGEAFTTASSQAAQIAQENGDFRPQDAVTALASGALTGLISGVGGKLAHGIGLPDVDAFLADRNITGSRRIPALVAAGLIEIPEEGGQSYQEQVATNLATGKPWSEGVASAAVGGGIGGGLMGSTMPAFRRGAPSAPPAPPDYGGVDQGVQTGAFGTDEEAVGTSFVVTQAEATPEFIKTMRENGFEPGGMLPRGRVLFKAISAPETVEVPDTPEVPDLPLNTPIQNQFNQGQGAQPGETTGRVAQMPASADQSLNTLLSGPRDEATVDAAANDFVIRVSKITDPMQLTRMMESIQLQPQTAVTRGLIDVVARRLNEIQPEVKYAPTADPLADTTNPEGRGNFGNEAWEETPDDALRNGPIGIVPPPVQTYTDEDRARMAENLRRMLSPPSPDERPLFEDEEARAILDRAMPPPAPERQPATEFGQDPIDQQIAEWERSQDEIIRGNQETRGPLMGTGLQRVGEQALTGEILPPAAEDYGPEAQGFLQRQAATGVQLSADELTRLDPFLRSLDAPESAIPYEPDIEEDEWGPITPGHAESLLPAPSETLTPETELQRRSREFTRKYEGVHPDDIITGDVLPGQRGQTEFERMFGLKPGEDMSDEEIERVKKFYIDQMKVMYGEDLVEGQRAEDEVTGTIGDERIHYPGVEESGEKNITPSGLRHPTAQQWDARMRELDAAGAPDVKYRDIASTLSRKTLKKGETWRGEIQKAIQYFESTVRDDDTPSLQRADRLGVAPFTPRSDDFKNYNKGRGRVQIYNLAEDLNNQLAKGIPDDPRVDTIMEQAERLLMNETDPEIIEDNYNQLIVYSENSQNTPDQVELLGQLRDIALDKLRGTSDKPFFAKVAGGGLKVDADIRRTAINITKDYTTALSGIMAREGLQNTLDAADKVPGGGVVRVRLNDKDSYRNPGKNSTIEMHDNGLGMNEQMLAEKLVRLFASGKENEAGATGGKGIGSASYILGGEYFEVNTVALDGKKKYRIIAKGTPEQFLSETGSDYTRTEVSPNTPTGTTIKVTLKDDQDIFNSSHMVRKIAEHSRGRKSKIIFDSNNYSSDIPITELEGDPGIIEEYTMKNIADDKLIGDFTFKDSKIKVAIPDFDARVERKYYKVHYLNNGMYQFTEDKYVAEKAKGIPEDIIVNVEPQMDEQEDNYPFINTREDVKKDMREHITEFIEKNISGPAIEKKKNRTQELYDSMPIVPIYGGNSRNTVIFDPGERFTKDELKSILKSPAIQEIMQHYDRTIQGALNILGRDNWNDRLEGIGLVFDPNMHGVHIPNPTTKKSTILLNPFIRMEQGLSPEDNAFDATITVLHEIAHIGDESGYAVNAPPLDFDVSQPRYGKFFASYMEQIRSHGDVTYPPTGHGVPFIQRLGEVYGKMGAANTFAAADKLERVFTGGSRSGQYSPEFQRVLQLYSESRGRPETTEDLLSGTGVKQEDRGSDREGNVSTYDQAVGAGTPVGSSVDRLRDTLPVTDDYGDTRFILPNGERLAFNDRYSFHETEARRAGISLYEALENGAIRFRDNAAEIASPITASQAVHLADSIHMLHNLFIIVDVISPNTRRASREFDVGTKPGAIRGWVNSFFQKMKEEKGAWNVFGRNPTNPPVPGWNKVQAATGIGSGGANVIKKGDLNWVKEAMAVPSAATTTMDLSAPFRQGLSQIHTPQFWKAISPMLKAGYSEQIFNMIDADLRAKPVMQARRNRVTGKVRPSIAQEAGLKMFETASSGAPMSQRAQATASRWLEMGIGKTTTNAAGVSTWQPTAGSKLWAGTIGRPIRASNRAYVTFLNHLKVNRFEHLMNQSAAMAVEASRTGSARPGIFRQSYTQQEALELNGYRNKVLAKELADFVNTATGQGPLKTHILPTKHAEVSLESASGALQHIFFSPGLIASRIRMLNPNTYVMASPQVRRQYMMAALATGTAWMSALTLMKMGGGDEVEVNIDNMTSADWGKAKIGDTRLDPGGGFQQFLVSYARMIQGGTTSSASGEWREFGEGFMAQTQKSNIERFLSNKLNPVTKFAYDLASQSEYNPFHVYDRIAQLFVPLVIQDLVGLYYEDPKMLPWMGPIMLGMGTQTYGRGESVGKLVDPENDWLASGGGFMDLGKSEDSDSY